MGESEEIWNGLKRWLEPETENAVSEAKILEQLELLLSELLQQKEQAFYQLMYRLDIPERKLMEALSDREEGVRKVARIIYERQIEKAKSRKQNSEDKDADPDLKW